MVLVRNYFLFAIFQVVVKISIILAEHEIFGEALSDSDEEHGSKINILESDEGDSDDSRGSGSEIYRPNSNRRVQLPTHSRFNILNNCSFLNVIRLLVRLEW